MESTLQKPALVAGGGTSRARTIAYWIVTGLFCLQMSFTAYAQLRVPQVAEAFTHLGFPAYFRVELSWAKFLGVVLLLVPVPARLKEWAYAGFAIILVVGAYRPCIGGRWPGGLGLGGGDRRAVGAFVLLLARVPPGRQARSGRSRRNEIDGRVGAGMKKPVTAESASTLIDQKIKELGDWRGRTLAKVREIVHEADPEIVEEWKWMGTPTWSHGGIVCTGETYKSVVKMTFAKGAALNDPAGLFNSSLDGNVRRAIDIREGEKINEAGLKDLIRAAVALNLEAKSKPKSPRAKAKRVD